MKYVDGFVIAIPKKNIKSYKKMAELGKKLWIKHGALDYYECLADDMHPKGVQLTFPKLTKTKPNEKVMNDPAMSSDKMKDFPMPFEMNRMAYGGFKTIVQK